MKLLVATVLAAIALSGPALADGDVAAGKKAFRKCQACHTAEADGKNKVGPSLHGVYGEPAGRNAKYKYSKAFQEKVAEGLVWTEENLDSWLQDPQAFIKKAKMVLKLRKPEERANVIAYLKSQGAD